MTVYPEYMDSLSFANINKGQIPFYCLFNTIQNIPLHYHDFVELSYVIEGYGTEILNGVPYALKPGSVSFLLPHHLHEFHSSPDTPLQVYCCMFDINLIFESQTDSELGQLLLQVGDRLPSHKDLDDHESASMKQACSHIYREYRNSEIGRNSSIRSKLIEALLIYVRSHAAPSSIDADPRPSSLKSDDWKIIQYVHAHYLDNIAQENLSAIFNVSPASISRLFNKHLGRSFTDYIHTLRIRRASTLLLMTPMTISEISFDVGFESFRTFSRVFKEIKHMTPRDYRQAFSQAPKDK
ncbi:AraC family transcriptional regulator [Paenibacillus mendelii]|uniref:Helix-turn-helix domain-containing protein n=1 Tax=Paenibacillus mendelii TaxID=206163 RepID=A0ABV6JBL2_9BACL|nr:helix-turn-helix transcriptional regulator [Paenibacillus mendelii]MCQ6560682.1 AraC family transcriptional regulator [Paenibacillus mendelii]